MVCEYCGQENCPHVGATDFQLQQELEAARELLRSCRLLLQVDYPKFALKIEESLNVETEQ